MRKKTAKKLTLHLSFVNGGEPFVPTDWTVKKHESALNRVSKVEGMSDKEKDEEFKYIVIHETLKEIDPSVELDRVKKIHPVDLTDLFWEIYNAGREGIYYKEDFRKGSKTPTPQKSKSTGMKSSKSSKKQ